MPTEPTKRLFTAKAAVLALTVVGVGVVLLILWFKPPSAAPALTLPNPNGYDDFQKAIAVYQGTTPDVAKASLEELRTHLEENRETLRLLRVGLGHQCLVPIQYTQSYAESTVGELAKIKGLALALKTDGKIAEQDNRQSDAVNSYLDTVRFGHEAVRGGLMIHGLVGIACEAIGLKPLEDIRFKLSVAECQKVVKVLEAVDRNCESAESILAREKVWGRRSSGWRYPLLYLTTFKKMLKPLYQNFEQKHKTAEARRRRLLVDAAVKWYQLEQGRPPKSLSELAPKYLNAVPQDPVTGKLFVE